MNNLAGVYRLKDPGELDGQSQALRDGELTAGEQAAEGLPGQALVYDFLMQFL